MRTPEEMQKLILNIANDDENIRAVLLTGSRADKDCPPDCYQDFDVVYFVKEVAPYWDNMTWIEEKFGKPALLQKPESMSLIPPDGDGKYVYLMLFPDGNRIDLCITAETYVHDGEPGILLLDKDGNFPKFEVDPEHWYVKKPDAKEFSDCCNEFHWCLNNVAKGIARDELSYAMQMKDNYVREMLILMLGWYIGATRDFKVSIGKMGKYFKNLLPEEMYESFRRTYSDAEQEHMWQATFEMLHLFGRVAREVAECLGFIYDEEEEQGIEQYMKQVRGDEV